MENWDALIPWMSELVGEELSGDFVGDLWDGILLCQLVNGIHPGKVDIVYDFENHDTAGIQNLQAFIAAVKGMGVDDAHLFDAQTLYEAEDADADIIDGVRKTVAALKTIIEQRGTLEQQNIWRKDAAEVRAGQRKVRANFANKDVRTLTDVTSAVRDFKGRTNNDADLRYQRQGQQKWKLFETNYQREKGISLEQSLAEIEEFERTGKMPESMKKKRAQNALVGASSGFRGVLEETLSKDEEKDGKTSQSGSSNAFGGGSTTGSGKGKMVGGGKRELNEKPKAGGAAGAAFYQKFAEKENRKFKPGNSNVNKDLW